MTGKQVFVMVWAVSLAVLFWAVEDWRKSKLLVVTAVVSFGVVVYLNRKR